MQKSRIIPAGKGIFLAQVQATYIRNRNQVVLLLNMVVLNNRDQPGKHWLLKISYIYVTITLKQIFAENTHLNAFIVF